MNVFFCLFVLFFVFLYFYIFVILRVFCFDILVLWVSLLVLLFLFFFGGGCFVLFGGGFISQKTKFSFILEGFCFYFCFLGFWFSCVFFE